MAQIPAFAGLPPEILRYLIQSQNYQARQDSQSQNQMLQLFANMLQQGQSASQQAYDANQSRYLDILDLLGGARTRTMEGLENFGQSMLDDAERRWTTDKANIGGGWASNHNMPGSTRRLVEEGIAARNHGIEKAKIQDMLTDRRLSADERFTDKATGVMERVTDAYPDLGGMVGTAGRLGNRRIGIGNMGGGGVGGFGGGGFGNRVTAPPTLRLPPAPTADQQRRAALAAANNANIANVGDRGAQVRLAQAYQGPIGSSLDNDAIDNANILNVLGGQANFRPGQTAPLVPTHPAILEGSNYSELGPLLQQLLNRGGGTPANVPYQASGGGGIGGAIGRAISGLAGGSGYQRPKGLSVQQRRQSYLNSPERAASRNTMQFLRDMGLFG